MARKEPIRKLLDAVFKLIKSLEERKLKADTARENGAVTAEERLSDVDRAKRKRRVRKLARMLAKPIGNAFDKSGLDIDNDQDWKKMLFWSFAAIYGGKSRGRSKKWSPKKLRQLQQDIANVKDQHPDLKELGCCKQLIRESENRQYRGVDDAETLRRVLQNAKRLSKDARLLASVRDDAVATDLLNQLKKPR